MLPSKTQFFAKKFNQILQNFQLCEKLKEKKSRVRQVKKRKLSKTGRICKPVIDRKRLQLTSVLSPADVKQQ